MLVGSRHMNLANVFPHFACLTFLTAVVARHCSRAATRCRNSHRTNNITSSDLWALVASGPVQSSEVNLIQSSAGNCQPPPLTE